MRKIVTQGYCLRSLDTEVQIIEVVRRYLLINSMQFLTRCLLCNERLCTVEKQAVIDRLEPMTKLYYDQFKICPNCDRIYWKGSHYERMMQSISSWAGLDASPDQIMNQEDGEG
jgi:hypothetical protein